MIPQQRVADRPDRPASAEGLAQCRLRCDASAGRLLLLVAGHLALTLATLGLYRFWARTRIRAHLWGAMSCDGEPFEYLGTPREKLLGFARALLVMVPLLALLATPGHLVDWLTYLLDEPEASIGDLAWLIEDAGLLAVESAGLAFVTYAARYGGRRYRMSRTLWRGIRFAQSGSPWAYAAIATRGLILTIATLGLYFPFHAVALRRWEIGRLSYGDRPFAFTGRAEDLYPAFLAAWVLSVPTLGLSLLGYAARTQAYYAEQTRVEGVALSARVSGRQLLALQGGNFLLTTLSLGLLRPLATARSLRFWSRALVVAGAPGYAGIAQIPARDRSGEGLAGFLNLDGLGS